MNNSFSDAGDQIFELGQHVAKKFVKDVVKGVPQTAKQQIAGDSSSNQTAKDNLPVNDKKQTKKTDPITGKPPPSKQALSQLTQATKQLQMQKLQKVREELEKQRLKVTGADSAKAPTGQAGPEIPETKKPSQDDAVAKTMRNSQSTGESRGDLVG
jgi:hypothetical protein